MIKLLLDLLPYQEKAVDKLLKYKIGACYMEMGTGNHEQLPLNVPDKFS